MDPRLDELERKIAGLERTLERLSERLAAVEGTGVAKAAEPASPEAAALVSAKLAPVGTPAADAPEVAAAPVMTPAVAVSEDRSPDTLPLVGRTFLVIGGAFLVRALTDSGTVPGGAGVALGLAFATTWLVFAWRAAAAHEKRNATFHAASAMLVGFPLIAETGTRLALIGPGTAGAVLFGFTTAVLATTQRHGLRLAAWGGTLAAVFAGMLLVGASADPRPGLLALCGVCLGAAWLADGRDWTGLRWAPALVIDFLLIRRTVGAVALEDQALRETLAPWLLGLTWTAAALFLGATVFRLFVRNKKAGPFEVLQPVLVVAVGLIVSARVEPVIGPAPAAAGALALLFGLTSLLGGEWLMRQGRLVDAGTALGVGATFLIGGGPLLTRSVGLALGWALLAVLLVVRGRTLGATLWWAVALALSLAAAVLGGVASAVLDGLVLVPEAAPAQPSVATWAVLGLLCLAALAAALRKDETMAPPAWLSFGLMGVSGLGVVAALAFGALALAPSLGANPAAWVLVRTLSLVGLSLVFAAAQRRVGTHDLGWASFAALGLALVKLLAQDLPQGKPMFLVVAFMAFGGAIIALPRLLKRPPSPASAEPQKAEAA